MRKTTEASANYESLETMSTADLLGNINKEDKTVPLAIEKELPAIEAFVNACYERMKTGGRLFYIGAGTSGRLGIVDASECPPTFGVPYGLVIGLIAGGEKAITQAVEFAEDSVDEGWADALKECRKRGIITGSISCNPNSPVSAEADFPVEVVVGPEFITGSTRMKSGTAQKLVLNMISTAVMIQLGRVEDNKMVNMQLSNIKLVDRGVKMVMDNLGLNDYEKAKDLLLKYGSVKKGVESVESE